MPKFTNSFVENLEVGDKLYTVSDDGCDGLSVRVLPSGSKTYFARMTENGKRVRKTIGRVDQIKLVEARKLATQFLHEPKDEESSEHELTLKQLFGRFEHHHMSGLKDRTKDTYLRHLHWTLERLKPDLPIGEISRQTVRQLKTGYGTGPASNRYLITMRKCWNWAIESGYTEVNPWQFIKKTVEKPREVLATQEQLNSILNAVRAESPRIKTYYLSLILTCSRRGEADKMRWGDLDGDTWVKFDTKNKKGQSIHLCPEVREAISELPKGKAKELVFQGFNGHKTAWRRILKNAGVVYPSIRLHDMRRTVATLLLTKGLATIDQISLMLGHSSVAITQKVYAKYLGDNKQAVTAISSLLE